MTGRRDGIAGIADDEQIADYLDATTPLPARSDLILVFGTRLSEPASIAAQLWHEGLAPWVVLTGGPNRLTGTNEAHSHRESLLLAGVPENVILVEDRSTNTHENVAFARPLMDTAMDVSRIHTIVAVTKWMHSRRALMTLKAGWQLPACRLHACTYAPENITRESWPSQGDSARQTVLRNWERIPRYLATGDLVEIQRDGDGWI